LGAARFIASFHDERASANAVSPTHSGDRTLKTKECRLRVLRKRGFCPRQIKEIKRSKTNKNDFFEKI